MNDQLDNQDRAILATREAAFNKKRGPRVGDFIKFSDGTYQRVSHKWHDGAQTTDGGSFYLAGDYCSFSGGLYPSIPYDKLIATDEKRAGEVWIFHHDFATCGGGVDALITFRVYRCDGEANSHSRRY